MLHKAMNRHKKTILKVLYSAQMHIELLVNKTSFESDYHKVRQCYKCISFSLVSPAFCEVRTRPKEKVGAGNNLA